MTNDNDSVSPDHDSVRVGTFGPDGWETDWVPRAEVPDGHLQVPVEGVMLYAGLDDVLQASQAAAHQEEVIHPEFPPAVRGAVGRIAQAMASFDPDPVESWVDTLRREARPWHSIARWELVVAALARFTRHLRGDDDEVAEQHAHVYVAVELLLLDVAPDAGVRRVGYETVAAERAREIDDWLYAEENARAFRRRRAELRAELGAAPEGPDRATLSSLVDEDGRPNRHAAFNVILWLADAPLVVAVDAESGVPWAVFHALPGSGPAGPSHFEVWGPGTLPLEYIRPGFTFPPATRVVEVDGAAETDVLLPLIVAAKGKLDPSATPRLAGPWPEYAFPAEPVGDGPALHPPFPAVIREAVERVARLHAAGAQPCAAAGLEDRLRRLADPAVGLVRRELVAAAVDRFTGPFARAGEDPADVYAAACRSADRPAGGAAARCRPRGRPRSGRGCTGRATRSGAASARPRCAGCWPTG